MNEALFFSDALWKLGSTPAPTSAESIIELQYVLFIAPGLFSSFLFNNSLINRSNICEHIPVFPTLPISSLSANIETMVLFPAFALTNAKRLV